MAKKRIDQITDLKEFKAEASKGVAAGVVKALAVIAKKYDLDAVELFEAFIIPFGEAVAESGGVDFDDVMERVNAKNGKDDEDLVIQMF